MMFNRPHLKVSFTMSRSKLLQQYHLNAYALAAAAAAAEKTVTVEIADGDLATLKGGEYKLCFAKKVGTSDYNVVWQSYDQYISANEFSWVPTYQIFGTNTFKASVTVKATTKYMPIGIGQQVTLDKNGLFGKVSSNSKNPESLLLNNDFGKIHPGVNQMSTGLDGEQINTPIYVATQVAVAGATVLTPVELVLVWFEQNIQTSTMFSGSRSREIEIDLTNSASETRLYEKGVWSTP
jgi:hypothetical protein